MTKNAVKQAETVIIRCQKKLMQKKAKCGTTTGYRNGCRCSNCKKAVSDYQASRKRIDRK